MTNKKKAHSQSRVHSKNSARQGRPKGAKKLQLPSNTPQPKTQLIPAKLQIGLGSVDNHVVREPVFMNNRAEIAAAGSIGRD